MGKDNDSNFNIFDNLTFYLYIYVLFFTFDLLNVLTIDIYWLSKQTISTMKTLSLLSWFMFKET